jgi:hypothetical protein
MVLPTLAEQVRRIKKRSGRHQEEQVFFLTVFYLHTLIVQGRFIVIILLMCTFNKFTLLYSLNLPPSSPLFQTVFGGFHCAVFQCTHTHTHTHTHTLPFPPERKSSLRLPQHQAAARPASSSHGSGSCGSRQNGPWNWVDSADRMGETDKMGVLAWWAG